MGSGIDISQFTAQLLAPLQASDHDALLNEVHEEQSRGFQRHWFLAEAALHRRDAQHYERLHNSFFGDNTIRDCPKLAEQARMSVERLVLTAAINTTQLGTKRSTARRLYRKTEWMPEAWQRAFAADEQYIERKRHKRRRASKREA